MISPGSVMIIPVLTSDMEWLPSLILTYIVARSTASRVMSAIPSRLNWAATCSAAFMLDPALSPLILRFGIPSGKPALANSFLASARSTSLSVR